MKNRYFSLRHGESEANVLGIILSDPTAGTAGYGLTERGREQARAAALGAELAGPETLIYSSPFARARETAEIAREVLGARPVVLRDELRERSFGELEGKSNDEYQRVWDLDVLNPGHTEWGVESVMSVLGRTSALVAELEQEHQGETIVLVSHGDALQIMETGFKTMNPAAHRSLPHLSPAGLRELKA